MRLPERFRTTKTHRVVSLRRSDTSGVSGEADTPGTSLNQREGGNRPSVRLPRFQCVFAGAILYPGKPARSIACCTNPDALACSINSVM